MWKVKLPTKQKYDPLSRTPFLLVDGLRDPGILNPRSGAPQEHILLGVGAVSPKETLTRQAPWRRKAAWREALRPLRSSVSSHLFIPGDGTQLWAAYPLPQSRLDFLFSRGGPCLPRLPWTTVTGLQSFVQFFVFVISLAPAPFPPPPATVACPQGRKRQALANFRAKVAPKWRSCEIYRHQ